MRRPAKRGSCWQVRTRRSPCSSRRRTGWSRPPWWPRWRCRSPLSAALDRGRGQRLAGLAGRRRGLLDGRYGSTVVAHDERPEARRPQGNGGIVAVDDLALVILDLVALERPDD